MFGESRTGIPVWTNAAASSSFRVQIGVYRLYQRGVYLTVYLVRFQGNEGRMAVWYNHGILGSLASYLGNHCYHPG